jgi:hypothetical protein
MRLLLIVLILSPLARAPAATVYLTGTKLLETCEAAESYRVLDCVSYIKGATDQFESLRGIQNRPACVPPGISVGRLLELTVTYLRAHPEARSASAASLVAAALSAEWNCD